MKLGADSKCASRFWASGSSNFRKRAVATFRSTGALRRSPSSELAQVAESDVVIGVGLPERRTEAQVVEHDAKRPCTRPALLRRPCPGHPWPVAAPSPSRAGRLVDLAEDVEVDDLPRVAIANGVERLEVGVDAALAVHVVERQAQVRGNVTDGGPVLSGDLVVVDGLQEAAVSQLQHQDEAVLRWKDAHGCLTHQTLCLVGLACVRFEEMRLDAAAEAGHALQHDALQACGCAHHRVPRTGVDGLLVRIDRLDGDDVLRVEADAPLELGTYLLYAKHCFKHHPRDRLGLRVAVVGGRSNSGGGRAVDERAIVDFVAVEQDEGGLHRLLARRHCEVYGNAAVVIGEPGQQGSGLDGLTEPVSVVWVGEDIPEE
eukprot:scaffold65219_cov60-Phaeocystis_antarctica.AAC.4